MIDPLTKLPTNKSYDAAFNKQFKTAFDERFIASGYFQVHADPTILTLFKLRLPLVSEQTLAYLLDDQPQDAQDAITGILSDALIIGYLAQVFEVDQRLPYAVEPTALPSIEEFADALEAKKAWAGGLVPLGPYFELVAEVMRNEISRSSTLALQPHKRKKLADSAYSNARNGQLSAVMQGYAFNLHELEELEKS